MIQYTISLQRLQQLLEQERPGWLDRAQERTDRFEALGEYQEPSSIWSEVKVVYMRLQYSKCAYCERQLESEEYGRIEHDLEHFRPKKKSKSWKLPQALQQAGVALTSPVSGTADPGYHLLAYNPLNYCTSCKTCNSRLKSNYFPIEGIRSTDVADPVHLVSEKPLLINPVGDFDDDPASLISFHGLSPMASGSSGYKRHRGLVSIIFFHLDDRQRKYLFRERANIIVSLFTFLNMAKQAMTPDIKSVYEQLVDLKQTKCGFRYGVEMHWSCPRRYAHLHRGAEEHLTESQPGLFFGYKSLQCAQKTAIAHAVNK